MLLASFQGTELLDGCISLGGELRWAPKELEEELRLQRWRCAAVDCQALKDLAPLEPVERWRRVAKRLDMVEDELDLLGDELQEEWLREAEGEARS